jgi:assimilatory nitrate reductase catalytic subunit
VLQEAYRGTETEAYADVLLPAATWGEKEGTATNSERRISRVRAAIAPPGEARADWAIASDFACRMESRLRPGRPTVFPYRTPEDIFNEHRETTRGRDLDITGLTFARLDADGPQQWPCTSAHAEGTARLYIDHVFATSDGRAQFAAVTYVPVAEKVDARYPFRLTTGRLRDQWHGMSRTGTVASLYAHAPEPALGLNPSDAARRGLVDGDLLRVESRRGAVVVPLVISGDVRPGRAYLPMHWGSATLAGRDSAGINAVTAKAFCPTSKQPELKHAAVRIAKAEMPWKLVAFGFPEDAAVLVTMRDEARQAARTFDYASVVLIGGERAGLLVRVACKSSPETATIGAIDRLFALDGTDAARYDDAKRAVGRRIRVIDGQLAAVRLSGDLSGEAWLREWLTECRKVAGLGALLLVPSAAAPGGRALRGRIVCNCFNVGEAQIVARLTSFKGSADRALYSLQSELHCGTNCGSCLPELRRLCAESRQPAEAFAP